ncbi:IS1634 family transposase [Oribacterium sp. P6A1]|uniref:IS1634 family transposase n=1 Tax=Oribacterium sp. P6A1 TaxID=1410612 RepID=UPI0005667DAE|nr:transposase [Oribacterium sp. P6A1]
MFLKELVPIPKDEKGISKKTIGGITYVYYTYERHYDPKKKYTVGNLTSIGKCESRDSDMMYPNTNYLKYFPDAEIPETKNISDRSGVLKVGPYLAIKKVAEDYHLDDMLAGIIGEDSGLFLDLAAYSIIAENNANQYYPDYAFDHPLFTKSMRIYSDSKVSDFINGISQSQAIEFMNRWNMQHDHLQKIYISYDSTNKNCEAGDIEIAEFGHAKDDQGKPIVNYAVAYDCDNSLPLFYEDYPGSITDMAQLQVMLEKAKGFGYENIGFILDRGYFSEENIHYMDKCGYQFVIMVKGMKKFVNELVLSRKGLFENRRENNIREYQVSGITVKRKLYPSDTKERYFHIYYSDRKKAAERENFEDRIDKLSAFLKKHEHEKISLGKELERYFDLIYSKKGEPDEKFMFAKEKYEEINKVINLCGYFVIITSENITAKEALELYKGRDVSEKLFRQDKSYLGDRSFRVHSTESLHAKIFIEFVALIIRNKLYRMLKDYKTATESKQNYFSVPAALRELGKVEMIRQADGNYRLDHAVTATCKILFKAFGLNDAKIKSGVREITARLKYSEEA